MHECAWKRDESVKLEERDKQHGSVKVSIHTVMVLALTDIGLSLLCSVKYQSDK